MQGCREVADSKVYGTQKTQIVDSSDTAVLSSTSTNQTNGAQKTQIVDGSGNVIGSLENAFDVHIKDVHDDLINRYLVSFSGTTSNLNAAASVGDTALTVVSDAAFTVGDWINITEGNTEETNFIKITAKPGGNVLTLDRPIDNAYTTGTPAVVEIVENNIASTAGTLAAPISYKIQPPANETWHIIRLLLTISDATNTAMTINLFGNIAALTNGVVVRRDNNGTKTTLTNWKSNADFYEDAYDVDLTLQSPGTEKGMAVRWTIEKAGSYVKLEGANSDYLEVLIQDDLTALDDFQIKIQGHPEG
jgi:hypothetical protein